MWNSNPMLMDIGQREYLVILRGTAIEMKEKEMREK